MYVGWLKQCVRKLWVTNETTNRVRKSWRKLRLIFTGTRECSSIDRVSLDFPSLILPNVLASHFSDKIISIGFWAISRHLFRNVSAVIEFFRQFKRWSLWVLTKLVDEMEGIVNVWCWTFFFQLESVYSIFWVNVEHNDYLNLICLNWQSKCVPNLGDFVYIFILRGSTLKWKR